MQGKPSRNFASFRTLWILTINLATMPISTSEQLTELQDRVRKAVPVSATKALKLLLEALPEGRAKYNQVLVLVGRDNNIIGHEIGNTLAPDLLAILRNELRKDLLVFTDHLTPADFGPKPANRPELRPGHLLYKVPPVMKLREAHTCIIRIAHQLNQVLEGITMDESVGLEQVSVSEVMEIEIIDPSGKDDPAFDIVLLSDGEQFVDEYSATEWVFNVRPLRAGSHQLALKVSVLITVNGKERTKNIIHQRAINVRAEAVTEETAFVRPAQTMNPPVMESADTPPPVPYPVDVEPMEPAGGGAPAPPIAPASAPRKRSSMRRYLSAATTVLLLAVASFWMLSLGNSHINTVDSDATAPDLGTPPAILIPVDSIAPVAPSELRRDSLE